MAEPRRVVITGVGVLTPIGTGIEGFWNGLRAQRSAVRTVTRFDPAPFRTHVAAEVDDFQPHDWMEARRAKRLDRCSQFSLAAARMALADAELKLEAEDRDRFGAMMGTALGGAPFAEREHERFLSEGLRGVDPGLALTVWTADDGWVCLAGSRRH